MWAILKLLIQALIILSSSFMVIWYINNYTQKKSINAIFRETYINERFVNSEEESILLDLNDFNNNEKNYIHIINCDCPQCFNSFKRKLVTDEYKKNHLFILSSADEYIMNNLLKYPHTESRIFMDVEKKLYNKLIRKIKHQSFVYYYNSRITLIVNKY